jgi:hypothetical protein
MTPEQHRAMVQAGQAWAEERNGGRTPTEAEYRARGLQRVVLRLPVEVVAALDENVDRSGYSRAELFETYIMRDREEWRAIEAEKKSTSEPKKPLARGAARR